jgi:glycopeptide antibiotics resistance protein
VRATYGAVAALFIAFAVWGTLFPFEVRPIAVVDALTLFWSAWGAGPGSWSRSDFVSNVILFVPIGLFACAAVDKSWPHHRVWPAVAVLVPAMLLSTGLELTQALVPWRTSSIVDVLAEGLGTVLGIGIWRITAHRIDAWLAAAHALVHRASLADRALLAYCLLFALAWLLPFDFTLRPAEIADKFVHKRLLLPFTPSPDALSPRMLMLTAIASIPLGIAALRFRGQARHPIASAMLLVVPVMLILEAGQVSVFSRTTDGTALLAVFAGALTGAAAARLSRSETAASVSATQ